MRVNAVILLNLILTILAARADETLPVLKVGADVYSNVTVTSVTSKDIWFSSDKGLIDARLKDLDPAMQKHFKYDAAKAAQSESSSSAPLPNRTGDSASAKAAMADAIARVKAIVNQPVRELGRRPEMEVAFYPGWFHPGAIEPDYKTVDVRATQQLDYEAHPYVCSDSNPQVVFIGPELEFNSMTKFFYVDRSVPKKKLTEAEMLEINRLYRIIGDCEDKLYNSPDADPPPALSVAYLSLHKKTVIIATLSALLLLLAIRAVAGRRSG